MSEELIAYANHEGPGYQTDNATVYRILQEILGNSIHMSSIKPMQRRRDGRAAFQALNLHNMGDSLTFSGLTAKQPLLSTSIVDSSETTKNPGTASLAHVHQTNPSDGQDGAILQQSGNVGSANVNMTKVSLPRPAVNAIFTRHPYFSNQ